MPCPNVLWKASVYDSLTIQVATLFHKRMTQFLEMLTDRDYKDVEYSPFIQNTLNARGKMYLKENAKLT